MAASSIFLNNKNYTKVTYTSSGTFVVPDGVYSVFVEMYGGGGSGAYLSSEGVATDVQGTAYGGEAGRYITKLVSVTPGASVSVTVGAGGAGVSTPYAVGNGGSQTSFGSLARAPGGFGGGLTFFYSSGPTFQSNYRGAGVGRNSVHAAGGSLVTSVNSTKILGGDAGFEGGGDAAEDSNGGNGGRGAGGGAVMRTGAGPTLTTGAGGTGVCIVYYLAV